jgi:alkanesulfonate monooxygenase SsuD/methylene tetrahydromethanopterin reductase-like flavin-dependent oxidoreductase (luciferase family)
MADIRVAWHVPSFPVDGSSAALFARQITDVLDRVANDYDAAFIDDHFVPWAPWQGPETPYMEGVTTMSYLAGRYPQLKWGISVMGQSYRNPALMAKMGANLQWFTGGRYIHGVGAGWLEVDYRTYNYEFPAPAVRIAQLGEALEITKRMWAGSPATFHGKYYRIDNAYCSPAPDPAPPILIGGGGEQLTLRVVAKYADWWNLAGQTPEAYAHKMKVLAEHCDAVGRDFDSILKTWSSESIALAATEAEAQRIAAATPYRHSMIVGTPEQVAEQLQPWIDAGVRYFIVRLVDFPQPAGTELFARAVAPLLQRG